MPEPAKEQDNAVSPTADAHSVQSLFANIAGVYDLLNRGLSFGIDAYWRRLLVRSALPFPSGGVGRILDLAAGTLEVSVGLARRYPRHQVAAFDFCRSMLRRGLPKIKKLRTVMPVVADARALPLPDASVDAVTIAFGLRNIRPRQEAYAEVLRVLAPGGRFCVLEFASAEDRILFGLYNLYLRHVLPAIGRVVSRNGGAYRYLAETVAAYPAASALAGEMREAGFIRVRHTAHTGGIVCLHCGEKPPHDNKHVRASDATR